MPDKAYNAPPRSQRLACPPQYVSRIRVIDNQNVLTYTLIIQNVLVILVPITIRDVAKRLNLSITTVSRALDGYDDVAKATRQRVIRTAREMGYAPSHTARQLRRSRADAIGYILPTSDPRFTDPFFSEFIAGLGDEATSHNLDLMISTAPPDKPAERQMYERWVHSRRVDGIVLSRMRTRDRRVKYLIKNKFPVVALGHTLLSLDLPYVEVDARAGFVLMIKHLVERGHKRIAYIGAPENLTLQVDRLAGFRDGVEATGLTFDESLIVRGDLTRAGGYQAAQRLLSLREPPTAIMGANDLTAIGAMRAAHERGLVVGRDVAIAGYDGIEDGEHTHPPLTTLKRSVYDLARRLVNMLLAIIEGEPLTERQVMLPPELIVRGSTGG
jgi:LacI family transcriptional regulator